MQEGDLEVVYNLLLEREDDPDTAPAFLEATRSLISLGRSPDRARAILDQIKCPVLAIHGRQDRLVPAVRVATCPCASTVSRCASATGRIPSSGWTP